jgi:putative transposase
MNLCKVAGIPRSVYYYQITKAKQKKKDALVLSDIKNLPQIIQDTSGAKCIAKVLQSYGKKYNHKRIARIRKENGICSKIRRHKYPKNYYKGIKENKANLPKNILNREFTASRPLEKLVTDITYFKVRSGWIYLSCILDLYNGEIVKYSFSKNLDSNLAMDTMERLSVNHSLKGSLIHSDQGAVYGSKEYRKILEDCGAVQSMSRVGNCWDNACIEQFFRTLKCETIHLRRKSSLLTSKELIKLLDDQIYFYNNIRLKKKLGWLSPVKFRESAA